MHKNYGRLVKQVSQPKWRESGTTLWNRNTANEEFLAPDCEAGREFCRTITEVSGFKSLNGLPGNNIMKNSERLALADRVQRRIQAILPGHKFIAEQEDLEHDSQRSIQQNKIPAVRPVAYRKRIADIESNHRPAADRAA